MSEIPSTSSEQAKVPDYAPIISRSSSNGTYKLPTSGPSYLNTQEQTVFQALMKMAESNGQNAANNATEEQKAKAFKEAVENTIRRANHEGRINEGPITQEVANAAFLVANNIPT